MDGVFSHPRTAYLALGSNLGDRLAALRGARQAIAAIPGTEILASSRLYETAPVGGPAGQGPYLNAVIAVATDLSPLVLLEACQGVEERFGRRRGTRWDARTLDLDILFYGESVSDDPRLLIPHPRLQERGFVLVPLAELAPGLVHPRLGLSIRQLLERLPDTSGVRLFAEAW